jgi:hypothetical protein
MEVLADLTSTAGDLRSEITVSPLMLLNACYISKEGSFKPSIRRVSSLLGYTSFLSAEPKLDPAGVNLPPVELMPRILLAVILFFLRVLRRPELGSSS